MNVFPLSLGRLRLNDTIETCDENPVVAPQSRSNRIALNFRSGDVAVSIDVFPQKSATRVWTPNANRSANAAAVPNVIVNAIFKKRFTANSSPLPPHRYARLRCR